MKALSIRQMWADAIILHGKDVENRTWDTAFRGVFLVHASKGLARQEYFDTALQVASLSGKALPQYEEVQRGGIIGAVELYDCVQNSRSPWAQRDQYHLMLRNPKVLPFVPCGGALGFWEVPEQIIGEVRRAGVL